MMNNLNVNTDEFVSMKISLVEVWHYKRCYRKVKKIISTETYQFKHWHRRRTRSRLILLRPPTSLIKGKTCCTSHHLLQIEDKQRSNQEDIQNFPRYIFLLCLRRKRNCCSIFFSGSIKIITNIMCSSLSQSFSCIKRENLLSRISEHC